MGRGSHSVRCGCAVVLLHLRALIVGARAGNTGVHEKHQSDTAQKIKNIVFYLPVLRHDERFYFRESRHCAVKKPVSETPLPCLSFHAVGGHHTRCHTTHDGRATRSAAIFVRPRHGQPTVYLRAPRGGGPAQHCATWPLRHDDRCRCSINSSVRYRAACRATCRPRANRVV